MIFFMQAMEKLLISCEKSAYLVSKKLLKELTLKEKIDLRMHAMVCKYCQRYEKEMLLIQSHFAKVDKKIQHGEFQYKLSHIDKERLQSNINRNLF
ncbi:MAG: hypothetical protein HC896_13045 [Bacteroidales bacterium]|nr:hypothetical protein [Bacteroidales bacterium]